WIDFVPANFLNSTHPDAVFVQKLLVIQHQPEGRFILLGNMLKSITADRVEKQWLTEDEIAHALENRFALSAR
ncbi:MAG: arylamine N-acetyltransferase, partial [Klebsiella grimontii]|nr:arylamine N-acetyltransferase [Klebsiella grimontii]